MLLPIKRILTGDSGVEVGIGVGVAVGGKGVEVGTDCVDVHAATSNKIITRNNAFLMVFPSQNKIAHPRLSSGTMTNEMSSRFNAGVTHFTYYVTLDSTSTEQTIAPNTLGLRWGQSEICNVEINLKPKQSIYCRYS